MSPRTILFALTCFIAFNEAGLRAAPSAKDGDSLIPLDPYIGDSSLRRHRDEVHKRFQVMGVRTFAQMIIVPAFEPEFSISLHGDKAGPVHFNQADKLFLTYDAADKNIWYSMPENNKENEQRNVSIAVTTVEFPKPLAQQVYRVWDQMLSRTRYFADDSIRVDATTAEFNCEDMYGKTYDPSPSKSVAYLLELGYRLIDYCKAPTEKRAVVAKAIENQARALEKYLKAHPAH